MFSFFSHSIYKVTHNNFFQFFAFGAFPYSSAPLSLAHLALTTLSLMKAPRLRIDQWQIGVKLPFSPDCHQSLASSALLPKPVIAKTTRMVRTKKKNCCCCCSSLFAAVASQLCQNEEDKLISGPRARKEFRPWSACFCQGCILGRMHVCMRSRFRWPSSV